MTDQLSSRVGPRSEFVYRSLLDAIREGRIMPGERIREEDVAKTLSVSRTPVREALQLLQTRRLVEMAPGRGIVVVELNNRQVVELYAMREVLEGASARFAAQHAMAAEIAMMHELCDEFDAAVGDKARLAKVNHQFHRVIYEGARNPYMHEALNHLEDALSLLQDTTFSLADRHSSASQEHRAILAAIEARDSDTAENLSRQHIREALRARTKLLMGR